MDRSDDEVEELSEVVSQYYLEDDNQEPISLGVLPVCWNMNVSVHGSGNKIYVRGKAFDGLQKLYKPVKAWKFDISGEKPEISVLTEDNNWMKLLNPRNSYQEFSRTVLITVNFLHLVKRNPELHGKFLWDKLSKIFRLLDDKPSPNDLIDHEALLENAVEHDDSLNKSKYLMMCLEKNIQKENRDQKNPRSKSKNAFIVDNDDCMGDDNGDHGSVEREDGSGSEDDTDEDIFDSVCSICDEGGSILCCEGICMRSFHATPRAAKEANSKCLSLGFSSKEVEAMQTFKCLNCQHKLHQCYSCGRLGSSDKESGAEVFQCVSATCGYFYHPGCVAKRLHGDNVDDANVLEKDIAAGEAFTCPLHVCFVCRQPEDKTDSQLRMAVCRRCPKAYHEKCLPREIAFEDDEDEDTVLRAWDNLLADRILIYCLEHEIDEYLGTPLRNHIKFPGDDKKAKQPFRQQQMKHTDASKYKKPFAKAFSRQEPTFEPKKTLPDNYPSQTDRKTFKPKGTGTLRNLSVEKKSVLTNAEFKSSKQLDSARVRPSKFENFPMRNSVLELDSASKTRILEFIEDAASRITLNDVIEKHQKLISNQIYKHTIDSCKSITLGKVEGSCKAIRAATVKLDAGGSIEDAKAICEPKILDQVVKWKIKLRVYLAPFLHGMRYTSFGRHFTKTDKLKEIVDKIQWYVNNGDTIVDFCCGANDFSKLMKETLEGTGKTCHYKNYDLFRPKNDFSFEERDWMSVQPKELPRGSQLIMGLNPPFGVKARLANQFINKALEFKPKLLILIVPEETERLDEKKKPYDLIWEDRGKLSGKSFYLPGSVDKNNKQLEDWNIATPILYLWSHPDWTARHKAVAKTYGHLHGGQREHKQSMGKFEQVAETEANDGSLFTDDYDQFKGAGDNPISLNDHFRGIHVINENLRKKRRTEGTKSKEVAESSQEYKPGCCSPFDPHHEWPHHFPVDSRGGSFSPPVIFPTPPANLAIRDPAHNHLEHSSSYRGMRSGFEIPGNDHDMVGTQNRQIVVDPSGIWSMDAGSHTDYPSQLPGEQAPAYLRRPDGYGMCQPYESAYSRTTHMSVMDKYGPRLDEPHHVRMSGYIPDFGHPFEPSLYSHQDPREGFCSHSMGFSPRTLESKGNDFKGQGKGKEKKATKGNDGHVAATKVSDKHENSTGQKCFYCKEMGHWKRNCPKFLQGVKNGTGNTSST